MLGKSLEGEVWIPCNPLCCPCVKKDIRIKIKSQRMDPKVRSQLTLNTTSKSLKGRTNKSMEKE